MNEFEEQQSLEIDNRSKLLGDVLKDVIIPGSKLQIAAATFSMFAYKDLKKNWNRLMNLSLSLRIRHLPIMNLKKNFVNIVFQKRHGKIPFLEQNMN